MENIDVRKGLKEKCNILELENEKLKIINAKQESVIKNIYKILKANALL